VGKLLGKHQFEKLGKEDSLILKQIIGCELD
jgi:hypothetical protein